MTYVAIVIERHFSEQKHGSCEMRTRANDRYLQVEANGQMLYVHRLVAAAILGRALLDGEHVHHKDRNKHNNAPENLEILSNADHTRLHHPPQTVCQHGHSMNDAYIRPDTGQRMCGSCNLQRAKRYYYTHPTGEYKCESCATVFVARRRRTGRKFCSAQCYHRGGIQ